MKSNYIFLATVIMVLIFSTACDRDSLSDKVTEPKVSEAEFQTGDFALTVDTMPEIIGGIESIAQNIKYPETAKDDKVGGTVYVFAYVDADGKVAHVEVARGVRDDLDLAAIEAVKPVTFKPGERDGEPVGVRVSIPIHFRLSTSE